MRMAFRDITQGGNTWKVRSDPLKSLITNILNSHNVDHCRNCLRSTLKQYISLGNSLEKDRPCATSWQDRIFKVTVLLLPLYAGKVPSSPLLLTHYLFSLHPIKKKVLLLLYCQETFPKQIDYYYYCFQLLKASCIALDLLLCPQSGAEPTIFSEHTAFSGQWFLE